MEKVILKFTDEERDITDTISGWKIAADGVRVRYHSSIVNGELVKDMHETLHVGACIKTMRVFTKGEKFAYYPEWAPDAPYRFEIGNIKTSENGEKIAEVRETERGWRIFVPITPDGDDEKIVIRNYYGAGILCVLRASDADGEGEGRYTRSAAAGDYSPSCPWNAPGMSRSDFL